MTLPLIRLPSILPLFRNKGHSSEDQDVFANIAAARGHSRKRRITTTAPRTVTVTWFLTQAQMTAFDQWFETVLIAGKLPFAAQVKALGPGTEWFSASWIEPPKTKALNNGWWDFTGELLLSGDMTTTPPATAALAVEFSASLFVTAQVTVPHALAVEFAASLDAAAAVPPAGLAPIMQSGALALTGYAPSIVNQFVPQTVIQVACGDELTPATVGQAIRFPIVSKMTLLSVRANLNAAQASGSIFTVDVKLNGTSIFSTLLTVDNNELTSVTAATPAVLSNTNFAVNDIVTIHVTQVGDGAAAGLKVSFVGLPVL